MDNDARSCYDCIICNLAMIVSQYFGMSANASATQVKTLKEMKFRLRTAMGDSNFFINIHHLHQFMAWVRAAAYLLPYGLSSAAYLWIV
jgi:hypothetical protein